MLMKLSTKQIADLLGVSTNSLRVLKSKGEMYKRLEDIGYKIIEEYKEGRSVFYSVEHIEIKDKSAAIKVFNKGIFGVTSDRFKDYYVKRTESAKGKDVEVQEVVTKQNIAEDTGVARQTVGTWDVKLTELGVIDEDGYIYLRVQCVPERKVFKSSIDDYKHYHKTVINTRKVYTALMLDHEKGLIDDFTLEFAYKEYKSKMKELADTYVIRIKAYRLNVNNPIHREAIRLYTE